MKKSYLIILTLVLMIVMCLFWHLSAQAQNQRKVELTREYYDDLEEMYVELLRDKLDSMGYEHAGITLTKVYLENGAREYTSLIHHRRIDRMLELEQEELKEELSIAIFQDDNCTFTQEFLAYEG